jgi:hypothetical protein
MSLWLLGLLGLLAVLLLAFWKNIRAVFSGAGRQEKGRWIRDRSLGGKMIFVPENSADSEGVDLRKPPRISALGEVLPAAASTTPVAIRQQEGASAAAERPEWWTYTLPLPVSGARQLECQKRAKKILKQLEDEKLLQGRDYDVFTLVQLYNTCKVRFVRRRAWRARIHACMSRAVLHCWYGVLHW